MLAYRFNALTSTPMFYEESSDMVTMLNTLNAGHIDAVLDYRADLVSLVPKLKQPKNFVILPNVLKAEAYFAFADTDKGRMLKRQFDTEHKKLIESGEQARLFKETKAEGF